MADISKLEQQAEIEKLQAEIEKYHKILNSYALQYGTVRDQSQKIEQIKSEAIEEFATEFERRCIEGGIYPAFVKRQLENVKEEMVGNHA